MLFWNLSEVIKMMLQPTEEQIELYKRFDSATDEKEKAEIYEQIVEIAKKRFEQYEGTFCY